jgi:hypothetical protein
MLRLQIPPCGVWRETGRDSGGTWRICRNGLPDAGGGTVFFLHGSHAEPMKQGFRDRSMKKMRRICIFSLAGFGWWA